MTSNVTELDELAHERAAIEKMGTLHWFHWVVILLSLVLTVGAWYFAKHQVEEKATNQFERAANQANH